MKKKTARRKPAMESLARLSEKDLLAMLRAGHAKAWEELSRRLKRLIVGEARRVLRELPEEVDEVAYLARTLLWEKREEVRSKRGVRRWIRITVRRLALKRKAHLERRPQYLQEKESDEGVKGIKQRPEDPAVEVEESGSHGPEVLDTGGEHGLPDADERFAGEMKRRLTFYGRKALSPEDEKIGWLLFGRFPLTRAEVGKELGLTSSQVRNAVDRIKRALEVAENTAKRRQEG